MLIICGNMICAPFDDYTHAARPPRDEALARPRACVRRLRRRDVTRGGVSRVLETWKRRDRIIRCGSASSTPILNTVASNERRRDGIVSDDGGFNLSR